LDIKQGRYTKNMLTSQTLKNEMGATIHHKWWYDWKSLMIELERDYLWETSKK
jgi:hypothetical protein